jgi:RNA polymerase sigma-70 factor (ECF subfamily)
MNTAATGPTREEHKLLAAARGGDQGAYRMLVEPHRVELHAHCYRMLGSVHDAEDALQEALLRAWRGLARFEGRSSPRTWLYKIATNSCLTLADRRPKRTLPLDSVPEAHLHEVPGRPLAESVWIEPYPTREVSLHDAFSAPDARYEQRENLELAFVAALQHLSPRQRAVLLLREVLGYSAAEVAELLGTTVVSVNSALQRARKSVAERLPAESQQATLRSLGDERLRELVQRYMDAMEGADTDAVLALLVEEAAWSMPPLSTWYHGREKIAAFLTEYPLTHRWAHLPTQANGQLAVGCYMWDEEAHRFVAEVIDVLTLDGPRISEITAFMTPAIFPSFGLPDELPATFWR